MRHLFDGTEGRHAVLDILARHVVVQPRLRDLSEADIGVREERVVAIRHVPVLRCEQESLHDGWRRMTVDDDCTTRHYHSNTQPSRFRYNTVNRLINLH